MPLEPPSVYNSMSSEALLPSHAKEASDNASMSRAAVAPRNARSILPLFLVVCMVVLYRLGLAVPNFHDPTPHCAQISPISSTEYAERQSELATALSKLRASAYIAEPGASTQYFAGFSSSVWHLSERPLLLIISPVHDTQPKVSILTPRFEATRAKTLPIRSNVTVQYLEWPEDGDPYSIALSALPDEKGIIFVDSSIRKFIADGLQRASPHFLVSSAPLEVTQIRERKSDAEIEIMKCANEATLLAIRSVQKKMYIGIKESKARALMSEALSSVGLQDGGCLTLFGENAALPHGNGSDKALKISDFALFDCTASLHGYYSDVTRTIALPQSSIPEEHLQIWNTVQEAQAIAQRAVHNKALTGDVDQAARFFLDSKGYAPYFTHRLGHGIGLEVHEQPYLRGGSRDIIKSGHTFSNEPGIYIEGQVGVRLEDCFYINHDGHAVYLTEGVGGSSTSPTSP